MLTHTEKLLNTYITKPRQTDYIKLVHWFGDEKMLKFNIYQFKDGYRLIPFGDNVYGVYEAKSYSTFDKLYTLNTTYDDKENYSGKLLAIIKFNIISYKQANNEHNKFWEWFYNKNEKRYKSNGTMDYKAAMHNVRLLRTGYEILDEGVVKVKRPDAEELKSIRDGAWSYKEILEYTEEMDNKIKERYKTSPLQKKPNIKLAAEVLMTAQDMMWSK